MSVQKTFAGVTYTLPTKNERGWAAQVTAFLAAVADNALTTALALAAEFDLGATYGIRSVWFRSKTSNPAEAGAVRLARADTVSWRNQANGADVALGVDTSNNLEWGGVDVVTATGTQTLTNKTLTNPAINGGVIDTPNITDPILEFAKADISGTPGAGTANVYVGRFAFAAGTGTGGILITNNLVTAASDIVATVITNDGTCKSVACVPGSGSFTAYANANATGVTKVSFMVLS